MLRGKGEGNKRVDVIESIEYPKLEGNHKDHRCNSWIWPTLRLDFGSSLDFCISLWSGWQLGCKTITFPVIHPEVTACHCYPAFHWHDLPTNRLSTGVSLHNGDSSRPGHFNQEKMTECNCSANEPRLCTEWSNGLCDSHLLCFKDWKLTMANHSFSIYKLSGIWLAPVL